MSNVVKLQGTVDESVIKTVASAMRTLWMTRQINTDAYFLGLNVLTRMQEEGRYIVNLTHEEIRNETVTVNGRPFGGWTCRDFRDFIHAMQELHSFVWLFSALRAVEFEEHDIHEMHFTRHPGLNALVDYTRETPIWFKLDVANLNDLTNFVDEVNAKFKELTKKQRNLEIN